MNTYYATADYDFTLPKELIAQDPLADRSSSRLMVLDRKTGALSHHVFSEITSFLKEGDLLVLNDTKVLPVRLHGVKKDTGAKAELLLLKRITPHPAAAQPPSPQGEGMDAGLDVEDAMGDTVWECLVRPGKKLRRGTELCFFRHTDAEQSKSLLPGGAHRPGDGGFAPTGALRPGDAGLHERRQVAAQQPDEGVPLMTATIEEELPDGNRIVRFTWGDDSPGAGQTETAQRQALTFEEVLDRLGEMPLPPYITHKLKDRDRYNTVYAKHDGSAAAPTAGLHFTPALLEELRGKGVKIASVTLHVGLGTFRPVKVKDVRKHHMHSEWYEVPEETARLVHETKQKGGRVICVGTTSCRTLESACNEPPRPAADA
ncbi:MAG: S-adenosylmethionine:tRNA ribosyltransferase-isomerase, partial [Lachnospiraceae bacterium]|nr:S-adenosylmethionine:tRNA ribosyltransferase-isomerase [Lachnospiraceae bacterium]